MTVPTFYYDVEDELLIAKFPEDFADFLADEGWDQDSRDFLARWKQIEQLTPNSDLIFQQVLDLATEYANIYEVGDETRRPTSKTYDQLFSLLRDLEQADEPDSDDETIPWDREGALVNRFLEDMPREETKVDEDILDDAGPEFPDVVLILKTGVSLPEIVIRSMRELWHGGYPEEARELLRELSLGFERDSEFNAVDIVAMICSYIVIEVDERASA